jgi:predicted dehydrogenase
MNIAIIGAGLQGWRRARAIRSHGQDRIEVVCDTKPEAAQRLASEVDAAATENWEKAVEDKRVHCVVVCTPPHVHASISIAALSLGKHTLCEKPMGRSFEEATKIASVAGNGGARLKVGYNIRHHPGIKQMKKWCDQGLVGRLIFARARYGIGGRPDFQNEWRVRGGLSGGGELMDQGLHLLDLSRWFLGDFSDVFGIVTTGFWPIAPIEDNAFALLKSNLGQVASLHASWTQWTNLFSYEVYGTDGYCASEGLGGSYGTERATLSRRQFREPFAQEVVEFRGEDQSWFEEWAEFRTAILEGREPTCNGADGREVLRLAEAIYKSAQEGRSVQVAAGGA